MAIKFREKALVKLQSPEQLDEPMRSIRPKRRLACSTFLLIAAFGLVWGIIGRLPKTGRGQGILMTPNSIVPVQAQADGQIGQWFVKVGDMVKKGEVLGVLEQPDIERQLEQELAKLQEVTVQKRTLKALRDRYAQLERESIRRRRRMFKRRIDYLQDYIRRTKAFAARINELDHELLEVRKQNLATATQATARLTDELKERLESFKRLRAENLASEDTLRNVRLRYDTSKLKTRDLDFQVQKLDLKKVQIAQAYLDARNLIASREYALTQLNLQLQQLDNREAQLDKQDREADIRDQNELDAIRRVIDRHRKRLQQDRQIESEYDGRILELTAAEGSIVTFSQRLVQIDTRKETDELITLAYFQDRVGKHLHVGMPVRVSPSTLDQKRYGSIRGEIVSVSEYPVTAEAVVNSVGNREVATKLTRGGYQIEVFVKLKTDADSPSGFVWTSRRSPNVEISSGTTADVWVTYERRSPISFILPKLRKWSGLSLSTTLGLQGDEQSQNPSVAPTRSR